jgi:SAM-dependent methyltransferase
MIEKFSKNDQQEYDFQKHWNKAYQNTSVNSLGWYEENPEASLQLIEECNLEKDALIFNAGAGATTLIKKLLENDYSNIIVNDISASALSILKNNLCTQEGAQVKFIVDDLTAPTELLKIKNVDLWHDRAVLHFFTSEKQQNSYFDLIKKVLSPNGFVILAEFNLVGAKKCSGLDVYNYNEEMLQDRLGDNFLLLKSFNYSYIQPSGNTREYVYTLFQRKE